MTSLKRNSNLENEFSLLTEMEMLHIFGGGDDIIINNTNTVPGCKCIVNSGSGSGSGLGRVSGRTAPPTGRGHVLRRLPSGCGGSAAGQ